MPAGVVILRTLTWNLLSKASRGSGNLGQEYIKRESSDWQPIVTLTELGARKHGLGDLAGRENLQTQEEESKRMKRRVRGWSLGQVSIFIWAEWMQKQEEVLGVLILSINVSVSVNFANES